MAPTVSGTAVTLTATSTDNIAVTGIQFKIDGASIGVLGTASPYSITWDSTSVSNGSHVISAVANDAAGNYATSAVSVIVSNTLPSLTPLSVTTSDQTANMGSSISFSATASGGVSPYSYVWNFGDGSATSSNSLYSYGTAGTYYAVVTATDASSSVAYATSTVTINNVSSSGGGGGESSSGGGGGGATYVAPVLPTIATSTPPISEVCIDGALFNTMTGLPCPPSIAITVCLPGDMFNSLTGARCLGVSTIAAQVPPTPAFSVSHMPATPYTYPPTPTSAYAFTHNLTLGSRDPDVKRLQLFLTAQGFLNKKYDTGYFGVLTRSALSKFQAKYGISPSVGYFGAVTRRAIGE